MNVFTHSKRLIPALLIVLFMALLWKGLYAQKTYAPKHDDSHFPAFTLQDARTPQKTITLADLKGKSYIAHVWASWCSVCIKEHKQWVAIANKWSVPVVGIIYRDNPNDVLPLLGKFGDPYLYLLNDFSGTLGLHLGIVGTPETYVVDEEGKVQFHHLGPVNMDLFESKMLPILKNSRSS